MYFCSVYLQVWFFASILAEMPLFIPSISVYDTVQPHKTEQKRYDLTQSARNFQTEN